MCTCHAITQYIYVCTYYCLRRRLIDLYADMWTCALFNLKKKSTHLLRSLFITSFRANGALISPIKLDSTMHVYIYNLIYTKKKKNLIIHKWLKLNTTHMFVFVYENRVASQVTTRVAWRLVSASVAHIHSYFSATLRRLSNWDTFSDLRFWIEREFFSNEQQNTQNNTLIRWKLWNFHFHISHISHHNNQTHKSFVQSDPNRRSVALLFSVRDRIVSLVFI